jgi:hypothetical protein
MSSSTVGSLLVGAFCEVFKDNIAVVVSNCAISAGATAITEKAMFATAEAAMPLQFRVISFVPPLIVMAASVGEKYELTKAGSAYVKELVSTNSEKFYIVSSSVSTVALLFFGHFVAGGVSMAFIAIAILKQEGVKDIMIKASMGVGAYMLWNNRDNVTSMAASTLANAKVDSTMVAEPASAENPASQVVPRVPDSFIAGAIDALDMTTVGDAEVIVQRDICEIEDSGGKAPSTLVAQKAFYQMLQAYTALASVQQAMSLANRGKIPTPVKAALVLTPAVVAVCNHMEVGSPRVRTVTRFLSNHSGEISQGVAIAAAVSLIYMGKRRTGAASLAILSLGLLNRYGYLPKGVSEANAKYANLAKMILAMSMGNKEQSNRVILSIAMMCMQHMQNKKTQAEK